MGVILAANRWLLTGVRCQKTEDKANFGIKGILPVESLRVERPF